MSKKLTPLSSREITKRLRKLGFEADRAASGSHQYWVKVVDGVCIAETVVVIGKKEVPIGTIRSMLTIGNITRDDWNAAR